MYIKRKLTIYEDLRCSRFPGVNHINCSSDNDHIIELLEIAMTYAERGLLGTWNRCVGVESREGLRSHEKVLQTAQGANDLTCLKLGPSCDYLPRGEF